MPASSHVSPSPSRFRIAPPAARLSTREKRVVAALTIHCAFPAWALGGMTTWGQWVSLLTGTIAVIVALWARDPDAETVSPKDAFNVVLRSPPVWAGALLLGYVLLQALNPAWRYVIEENEWWMERMPHISWLPAGMEAPYRISNPWRSLVILGAAWLGVVAIVAGVRTRPAVRVLLTWVVVNAAAVAGLGLAQQLARAPGIFWSFVPPDNAVWFATFVYRNHAAAFLVPCFAAALALAVHHHRRAQRHLARSGPAPVFVLLAVLVGLGAVFSFSRTGALLAGAIATGTLLWTIVLLLIRPQSRAGFATGIVLVVVLGALVVAGIRSPDVDRLQRRFNDLPATRDELADDRRIIAYQASYEMLQARWLSGWGAGCFRYFFPVFQENYPTIYDTARNTLPDGTVQETKLPRQLYWEHAHNDLLEFPVELGLIGTFLLAAGPLWWLFAGWRAGVARNAPGIILLAGLLAAVVHAGADFVFQNPAVWLLWSALGPLWARWNAGAGESADNGSGPLSSTRRRRTAARLER